MSFANTYLKRYSTGQVQKLPVPSKDLFLTIVIPVYNEPGLLSSLGSLLSTIPPGLPWEIILVVNEPAGCPESHHQQNIRSVNDLEKLKSSLDYKDLEIYILYPDPFPKKKAGPGFARKIGMDEAVRRYNELKRPEGLIVSFDADTLCEENYLSELKEFFFTKPSAAGATIHFEHPLNNEFDIAISQYELYLRYFKMSLEYIGFPYACYSLGSAFAVRAETYVKAGGMGLQQAGEDFYFLQKCIPLGNFWEINETTVYPASRISDRVVFGTGPFIKEFVDTKKQIHMVFPFELFQIIKPLFSWINSLTHFPSEIEELIKIVDKMPPVVKDSIIESGWIKKIKKAYSESALLLPFIKKFYHEINLLQLIHLFNLLSERGFSKSMVESEYYEMSKTSGKNIDYKNASEMLKAARGIEKSKGNIRIS